jgi:hypothetical protein
MKQQINEIKRMKTLAGLLKESQLNEELSNEEIMSQIKNKGFNVESTTAFHVLDTPGGDYLVFWNGSEWIKMLLTGSQGDLFEDAKELIDSFE